MRRLGILCLAAIAACASPEASQCEKTGVLCPSGSHCAAAQSICIPDINTCGDAHKDVEKGEVCDDGNIKDGDGCSHDCKSHETCGNGIIDAAKGEVCDDGNQVDGDGCSANCKSDERCGNGIVDRVRGEVCDPPGKDGCQPGCMSTGNCGNGIVDPGEECDDGIDHGLPKFNGDDKDCRLDCIVNRCGDGKIDLNGAHHEDCDDGDQIDTNACTNECKAAVCGDGILGPGEECDDHNLTAGDGCSATCKKEFCGDGVKNDQTASTHEDCDSSGIATDACNFNCTDPRCGDGIVNDQFKPNGTDPEQCDPPSAANGCSNNCRFEHCGNGVKDPGEECDGTDGVTGGQICSASCHIQRCGNGILDPGEQCDDGNNLDTDDCISSNPAPASCKLATCGDGHIDARTEQCDDGANNGTAASTCSATCHIVTCGNGVKEQGEECDDGNASDADDCLSSHSSAATTCKLARCGDGVIDKVKLNGLQREDCDDGALNGTHLDRCSATCRVAECGNGVIDQDENCDDGPGNNGAGKRCNTTCHLNVCGDGDAAGAEQCDAGFVDINGLPNPRDHLLPDGVTACDADCTLAVCGDGHTNAAAGEDCDDGAMNGTGLTTCDAFCHLVACGNDIVEHGEQCDPGGGATPVDTASCLADCHFSRCGDSHTNLAVPEACDEGDQNGNPCDYGDQGCSRCNSTCTGTIHPGGPFCGDSQVTNAETCDDGARNGGKCTYGDLACLSSPASTVCNASCTGKVPNTPLPNGEFCGDNVVQAQFHEQCDPGGGVTPLDSPTCDSDCSFAMCGDGHLNTLASETCDDGNTSACGSCSADCQVITLAFSFGTIKAGAGNNVTAGATFTLNDGVHTSPVVFTFAIDAGVHVGATLGTITVAPSDTAVDVASKMQDAINAESASLNIHAQIGGGGNDVVELRNTRQTSLGNTTIAHSASLEPAFTFTDFTLGAGGDCAINIGCTRPEDCASNFCDPTTKRCKAPPP